MHLGGLPLIVLEGGTMVPKVLKDFPLQYAWWQYYRKLKNLLLFGIVQWLLKHEKNTVFSNNPSYLQVWQRSIWGFPSLSEAPALLWATASALAFLKQASQMMWPWPHCIKRIGRLAGSMQMGQCISTDWLAVRLFIAAVIFFISCFKSLTSFFCCWSNSVGKWLPRADLLFVTSSPSSLTLATRVKVPSSSRRSPLWQRLRWTNGA